MPLIKIVSLPLRNDPYTACLITISTAVIISLFIRQHVSQKLQKESHIMPPALSGVDSIPSPLQSISSAVPRRDSGCAAHALVIRKCPDSLSVRCANSRGIGDSETHSDLVAKKKNFPAHSAYDSN